MRFPLLLLPLLLSAASAQPAPPGVLTIRFLDVGQGDAVLMTSPDGKSLMYDGGRTESRMRELIRQYSIQNVVAVVASHADSDHSTGLIPIVALNRPKFFIHNGIAGDTQTWQKLVNVVGQAGTQGLLTADQVLNLGDVKVTVLPPPPGMPDTEQNLNSIGLLIEYAGFRALMTGDSEPQETNAWLRKYTGRFFDPIYVYKAIHHGSLHGETRSWLAAVRPKNVVVSVGPNDYGHPALSTLALYQAAGAKVYRTDQQGTVTVTVKPDGSYTIGTERSAASLPAPQAPAPGGLVEAPQPAVPSPARDVYYANCAAVRAAGKSPLLRGQPGYRAGLDRDGDGRACE